MLADWHERRPQDVRAKSASELLRDWFASILVLSTTFNFRPALGQTYYLYCRDGDWQLSLVAPQEWRGRAPGACLGQCELRSDMTWALEPVDDLDAHPTLGAELEKLIEGFTAELEGDGSLGEHLPGYRRELPYYQRMLATALGTSLRASTGADVNLEAPVRALLESAGEAPLRLRG